MTPIQELQIKIRAYEKAYESLRTLEDNYETPKGRHLAALSWIRKDLAELRLIQKDWDMGFITPEQLQARL